MLIVSFKNKYIILSAVVFSPRHYSPFFIKFPFSCVQLIHCLYKWNLNICLYNYLCWECLPSLLPASSPKRCKLAETTCISRNFNEICLKTPNPAETHEFLPNICKSWQKRSIRTEKHVFVLFLFLQNSAYFTFKNTMFSAK